MNNDYTPYQLDPEFYDRLKSLQNRVPDVRIQSGYRSDFQQQQLRDEAQAQGKNPDDWFSPAGQSAHNYGLAADLTGNLADVHRYAPLYGLFHALTQDPWHVEPAYVTELGLPYKPEPRPVSVDYLNTAPTGDKGLDANLRNQADARAAAQMKTVPAGIPQGMLDPSLRMNLPEARSGATLATPAGQPITQPVGDKTVKPDQGVSPDQSKQAAPGVGSTPDLSAEVASGEGAREQRDQLARNKLQDTMNKDAANTNTFNQGVLNAGGTVGGSGAAIVNAAMGQVGKPYSTSGRFGPNAFDCSGLVVFALRATGHDPGGAQVSTSLQQWGQPVDLQTAYRTPGAMLFVWGQDQAGHVEISRGDGTTIGAGSGGVQVRSALNRGWTGAALPPGVGAGGGPAMVNGAPAVPAAMQPGRVTPTPNDLAKYAPFSVARMTDIMKRGGAPGQVPTPVTAPVMDPNAAQQPTIGNPPVQPDAAAQKETAATVAAQGLPPGAPPPASQPGNPNPVSTPIAVAPGQTPEQAEAQAGQQAGQQVALPKDVVAGSGKGEALGLGAYASGKTAVPGGITPEEAAQNPELQARQQQAAGGGGGDEGDWQNMNSDQWLAAVARDEHLTPQETGLVHQAMMRESGGRNIPQAVNDINMQRGDPAFGPLQIIGSTFRSYADPGWDRGNPIQSMRAAVRYARSRYGGSWAQRMASSGY